MAGFWHIGSLAFPPRSLNKWKQNMRMSFLLSQPCVLNILNFNFPEVFMGVGKVLTFILLLQLFSVFWSLDPVPFLATSNSDFCTVSIFMKRKWKTNIKVFMTLEKVCLLTWRFVSYYFNIILPIISQFQKFKFRSNYNWYNCQFLIYTFSGLDFKTNNVQIYVWCLRFFVCF